MGEQTRAHLPPAAFDWNQAWMHHRDCLPHLRQHHVIYFITFRLADSLPQARLDELRERRDRWLAANPLLHTAAQAAVYHHMWTAPIERLLDAGHGQCVLRDPGCRQLLETAMRHDDGTRYQLGEFVIMPNHVHVLLYVPDARDLSDILQAWKSISARRMNRFLKRRGSLWQAESFDHIVRGAAHWQRFIQYIRRNPAHFPPNTFTVGCGALTLETPPSGGN